MLVKTSLKRFFILSNRAIKLRQNYNILYNLLKANCVTKDVHYYHRLMSRFYSETDCCEF